MQENLNTFIPFKSDMFFYDFVDYCHLFLSYGSTSTSQRISQRITDAQNSKYKIKLLPWTTAISEPRK